MYHSSLIISSFWKTFPSLDIKISIEFIKTASCKNCGCCTFHRADYPRKPRGFPNEIEKQIPSIFFCSRISYRCSNCRKRITPQSVRYLGRKIYISTLILLAVRLIEQGSGTEGFVKISKEIRVLLKDFVPAKTVRRWLIWWQEAVWQSPFWKSKQGLFSGHVERYLFLNGVWNHFAQSSDQAQSDSVQDLVIIILTFFSPLTHPPNYPF
jgi:hypothetical protein